MKRSEESWNRRCALEFIGLLYQGRGFGDVDRWQQMEQAFDWALAALDPPSEGGGSVPEAKPEKNRVEVQVAPNPAEVQANAIRAASEGLTAARQRWLARNPEGAGSVRSDVENAMVEVTAAPSASFAGPPEAAPRNVPTEGDGSMAGPIYRFYAAHDDPPSTGYVLWREDTRNLFGQRRWSSWDSRNERWLSQASTDHEADLDQSDSAHNWERITAEKLTAVYRVPVESRHDVEES